MNFIFIKLNYLIIREKNNNNKKMKIGTIIYSVNKFGDATPYIVWCIEDDWVYCISITPASWNNDRLSIETDKISHNCFNEDDAERTDIGNVSIPKDENKINRYWKNRFNE